MGERTRGEKWIGVWSLGDGWGFGEGLLNAFWRLCEGRMLFIFGDSCPAQLLTHALRVCVLSRLMMFCESIGFYGYESVSLKYLASLAEHV